MKRGILDSPQMGRRIMCAKVGLVLNLLLSVSAISAHKYIFVISDFPNLMTTVAHLVLASFFVHLAAFLGFFSIVNIMRRPLLVLSVGFCTLVTFANLSLQYNTFGTFLMLKTTTLIWIPLLHLIKNKYVCSRKTLVALSPVVFGGALHFYFDSNLNLRGVSYGLISALVTSVYQVYVSEVQKGMQVSSLQLLYYEAPMSALLLIPFVMYFELTEVLTAVYTPRLAFIFVGISGVCASLVHFTTYWTIGNATCTEYNVVSQMKFAATLIVAYCVFDSTSVDFKQIVGDVMVLCGIIIYTHLKLVESIQEGINRRDRVIFPTRRV